MRCANCAELEAKIEWLETQISRLSLIGNEQAVLAWKEVQRVLRVLAQTAAAGSEDDALPDPLDPKEVTS